MVIKNKEYDTIKKGQIKNPYHPSVCGIGYFGVGKYKSRKNSKVILSYNKWTGIINRCYNKTNSNFKNYGAKNVIVNEHWHNFQNFAEWFEENWKSWMDATWDLDKDISGKDIRVYSTDNCFIVPKEINNCFIKIHNRKSLYPVGIRKLGNKFIASCGIEGKQKEVGKSTILTEAFNAYKEAKEKEIKRLADKYRGQITEKCYQALYNYRVEITD